MTNIFRISHKASQVTKVKHRLNIALAKREENIAKVHFSVTCMRIMKIYFFFFF